MPSQKTGLAKVFLISFLTLVLIVFLSTLLFTELILPKIVRSAAREFVEDKGQRIEIRNIGYGFPFGFEAEGIAIFDPLGESIPFLSATEVDVNPDIVSSLLNRRITIDRIVVKELDFRLTEGSIASVRKLLERESPEKPPTFDIERAVIKDFRIGINSQTELRSNRFEFVIRNTESKVGKKIDLNGSATLKQNEFDIEGKLTSLPDETRGGIKITLEEVDEKSFPDGFRPPSKLSVVSDITFEVSGEITSQGNIRFFPREKLENASSLTGVLQYNLLYEGETETLFLENVSLDIDESLSSSFRGMVREIKTSRTLEVGGHAEITRLENISKWIPALSETQVSGQAEATNLLITGAMKKNKVSATGEVFLSSVDLNDRERRIKISALEGNFDFNNTFDHQPLGDISASGNFSLANFSQKEIGELNNVSGKLRFTTNQTGEDKTLNLSSLRATYAAGALTGDMKARLGPDTLQISGNINGTGLNLNTVSGKYTFTDLEGDIKRASADFIWNGERFSSDLSFVLRDFKVEADDGQYVQASRLESVDHFEVTILPKEESDKVRIKGGSLSYLNLVYKGFGTESGSLRDIEFFYGKKGEWKLDFSAEGKIFQTKENKISIGYFDGKIKIRDNGELVVTGNISGREGAFRKVSFPTLASSFTYKNDWVKLTDLKAQVETYAELEANELNVFFGDRTGSEICFVSFSGGNLTGSNGLVKSVNARGKFTINNGEEKSSWSGSAEWDRIDIKSESILDVSSRIKSSEEGMIFENISGIYREGKLSGKVILATTGSTTSLEAALKVTASAAELNGNSLSIGELELAFKGDIRESPIPQGSGEINITDLTLGKDGEVQRLGATIPFQTSDETLTAENGFISSEGDKIAFSGKVQNISLENRIFILRMPEVPLSKAKRIFSPFLPDMIRQGEVEGELGFNLIYRNFLTEKSSRVGDVFLRDLSFSTKHEGTPVLLKNINGNIPLSNSAGRKIALAKLMGERLELNKEIYATYLNHLDYKERAREYSVTAEQIEYGFLKLSDLKSEIEIGALGIDLIRLESEIYRGKLLSSGSLKFVEDGFKYNFSFLFNEISLESISDSLPPLKDYITGKVNGIAWMKGEEKLRTLDGIFYFWSIESEEPRKIGRALLQKLGAKTTFFLRSSRSYEKGEIFGYIYNGLITFKKLSLSNTTFGYEDLSIQVDQQRNSITTGHLLSVIREVGKRAREGRIKIDVDN